MTKPDRPDGDGLTNAQLAMALRNNLSLVGSRNDLRDLMATAAARLIANPETGANMIERSAKIAEPWPGFSLDENSTDIDRAVVAVRTEIAEKIRAIVSPTRDGAEGAGDDAHVWHMKPTTIPDEMFKRPVFVADALRKMVANCVSLHASKSSLYTDGERKTMLAAAEHIEAFVAAAPPPSSTAGEG